MLRKLLISSMTTLLFFNVNSPLETQAKQKNSLINKFCIASLKSRLDIKDKQKSVEIINSTCECFVKKYKSGYSLKNSRIYCKDISTKKFNLNKSISK